MSMMHGRFVAGSENPFVDPSGGASQSHDLAAAWRSLRRSHGLNVREVACFGAARTVLLAEFGSPGAPTVALHAGVHGDEPAAPWALYEAVRDRLLDPRFAYRIWPCTNPTGLDAGTRVNAEGDDINRSFRGAGATPEARAIITANRDRRFALALDLHEDSDALGFYCYESLRPDAVPVFAQAIVAALDEAGLALQVFAPDFDLGTPPGSAAAYRLARGQVLVDAVTEERFFEGWPLSLRMLRAAEHALTFETPSSRAWEARIAMHRVALVSALATLGGRLANWRE